MAAFHHGKELNSFARRRKSKPKPLIRCPKSNNTTKVSASLYDEAPNVFVDVTANEKTLASPVEVSIDISELLPDFEGIQIEPDSFHKESLTNPDFDNSSHSKFRVTDCDVIDPSTIVNNVLEENDAGCNSEFDDFAEAPLPVKEQQSTNNNVNVPVCPDDIINLNLVFQKTLKVSCERLDLEQFCKLNRYRRISAETVSLKPIPLSPEPVEKLEAKRMTIKNYFNKALKGSDSMCSQSVNKVTTSNTRPIVIWPLNPRNQLDHDSDKPSNVSDEQITKNSPVTTQSDSNLNISCNANSLSSDASIKDPSLTLDNSFIDSIANNFDLENLDLSSLENEETMNQLVKELKSLLGVTNDSLDENSCIKNVNGDDVASNEVTSVLPNVVFPQPATSLFINVPEQYNNIDTNTKIVSSNVPYVNKCHRNSPTELSKSLSQRTNSSVSPICHNPVLSQTSTPIDKVTPHPISPFSSPENSTKRKTINNKNKVQPRQPLVPDKVRSLDDIKLEMESFMLQAKPATQLKTVIPQTNKTATVNITSKLPSQKMPKSVSPKTESFLPETIPHHDFGGSAYNSALDCLFGACDVDFGYGFDNNEPTNSDAALDSESEKTFGKSSENISNKPDKLLGSLGKVDSKQSNEKVLKKSDFPIDSHKKPILKKPKKKVSNKDAFIDDLGKINTKEVDKGVSKRFDSCSDSLAKGDSKNSIKRVSRKSGSSLESSSKGNSESPNNRIPKPSDIILNDSSKMGKRATKRSGNTTSYSTSKTDSDGYSGKILGSPGRFPLDHIKNKEESPSVETKSPDGGKNSYVACSAEKEENLKDKKKSLKCCFKKSPIMKVKIGPYPIKSKKFKDKMEILNKKRKYKAILKKKKVKYNTRNNNNNNNEISESANSSSDDTNLSPKKFTENSRLVCSTKAKPKRHDLTRTDKTISNSVSSKLLTDINANSNVQDHEKEHYMTGNSFASRSNDSEEQSLSSGGTVEKILEPSKEQEEEEVQYFSDAMNKSKDSENIEPKLEKNASINETAAQHADGTEDLLSVNIRTEKIETLERTENMDASSEASQPLSPVQPDKDISSSSVLDRLESFENKVTSDVDQTSDDACQDIEDIEIVDTSDSLLNTDDQSVSFNDTEEMLKEAEREQSANEKLSGTLLSEEAQDTTNAVEEENTEELPNAMQSTTECNKVQQGAPGNSQKGDQLTEMVKDQQTMGTSISQEESDLIEKITEQADLTPPLMDSSKELDIDENDNKLQVEEATSKMSAEETSTKMQSDPAEMQEEHNLIDSAVKPVITEQLSKEQSNKSLVSPLSCKSDVNISSNSVDKGNKLQSDTSGTPVVISDGKVNDNQVADTPKSTEVVDEQQPSHADQSCNDNSTQLEDDLQLSSDDSSDNLIIIDEVDGNGGSKEILKNESSSQSGETSQSASNLPSKITSESNEGNKTQISVSSPLTSSKKKSKEPPGKRTQVKSVEKLKISCIKKTNSNDNKKKDKNRDIKNWVVSSSGASQEGTKPEAPKYNLCAEDYEILKNVNLNDAVVKVQKLELDSKRFSQSPSSLSTPDVSSPAVDLAPQNGKVPYTRTSRNKTKKRPFSPTEEKMKKEEENSASPVPVSRVVETTHTSIGKKKKKYSEEDVIKPFKFGWMREVVHRAAVGKTQNRQSDVYYFNPEGGKLRSMPEISKYLSDHKGSGLSIENFTFVKTTIYRHPFEQERDAKVKSAMTAAVDSSKRKDSLSVKHVETSAEKRKASSENKESIPAKKARLKGTPLKSETPLAKDHKKDIHEKSTGTKETRSKDSRRNLTAQDTKIIDVLIKDTFSKETKTKHGHAKDSNWKDTKTKDIHVKDPNLKDTKTKDIHVKDSHLKETKTKDVHLKDVKVKDTQKDMKVKDTQKDMKVKDTQKDTKVKDIQKDFQTKDSNRSKSAKVSVDWSPKLKSKRPTLKVKITKGPTKEKEVATTTTTPMSVAGSEIEQDLLQILKTPVEKQTGIKADESSKKKAKIKSVTGRKCSKKIYKTERRKPRKPCTRNCLYAVYQIPSIYCSMCYCLFHRNCIFLPKNGNYICEACKRDLKEKESLDETIGIGEIDTSYSEMQDQIMNNLPLSVLTPIVVLDTDWNPVKEPSSKDQSSLVELPPLPPLKRAPESKVPTALMSINSEYNSDLSATNLPCIPVSIASSTYKSILKSTLQENMSGIKPLTTFVQSTSASINQTTSMSVSQSMQPVQFVPSVSESIQSVQFVPSVSESIQPYQFVKSVNQSTETGQYATTESLPTQSAQLVTTANESTQPMQLATTVNQSGQPVRFVSAGAHPYMPTVFIRRNGPNHPSPFSITIPPPGMISLPVVSRYPASNVGTNQPQMPNQQNFFVPVLLRKKLSDTNQGKSIVSSSVSSAVSGTGNKHIIPVNPAVFSANTPQLQMSSLNAPITYSKVNNKKAPPSSKHRQVISKNCVIPKLPSPTPERRSKRPVKKKHYDDFESDSDVISDDSVLSCCSSSSSSSSSSSTNSPEFVKTIPSSSTNPPKSVKINPLSGTNSPKSVKTIQSSSTSPPEFAKTIPSHIPSESTGKAKRQKSSTNGVLSDNLWTQIFKCLNIADSLKAAQVCQNWKSLIFQPPLWKEVSFNGLSVRDWSKCTEALKQHGTKAVCMRGMTVTNPDESWPNFLKSLENLENVEHLTFDQVPPKVLEAVADALPLLRSLECCCLTATCKRPDLWETPCQLNFSNIRYLRKLRRLKIRSAGGLISQDASSVLQNLPELRHLSLTTVKVSASDHLNFLSRLQKLMSLEFGDCNTWTKENYAALGELRELRHIRLENGGDFRDNSLPDALKQLKHLEELHFMNFRIPRNLARAIGSLTNLKKLCLWPDISKQMAESNYNAFQCAKQAKSLKTFIWGIISPDDSVPDLQILKDPLEITNGDESNNTEELDYEELFAKLLEVIPEDTKAEIKCISQAFFNEYCCIQR